MERGRDSEEWREAEDSEEWREVIGACQMRIMKIH